MAHVTVRVFTFFFQCLFFFNSISFLCARNVVDSSVCCSRFHQSERTARYSALSNTFISINIPINLSCGRVSCASTTHALSTTRLSAELLTDAYELPSRVPLGHHRTSCPRCVVLHVSGYLRLFGAQSS